MDPTTLPIYETIHTFQGEGVHMGRAAFFIRTHGCPLHCHFCDSAGTWHPDFVPADIRRVAVKALATEARVLRVPFAVLTGGEPAIHDLQEYSLAMRREGVKSHIETSGAFKIRGSFDWITLSPKVAKLPLIENIEDAHEFKIIVEDEHTIRLWEDHILARCRPLAPVWLHPEWSQRENPVVLRSIVHAVKDKPTIYRAGYQVHRLYGADLLCAGSDKRRIPLGGNPEKGF